MSLSPLNAAVGVRKQPWMMCNRMSLAVLQYSLKYQTGSRLDLALGLQFVKPCVPAVQYLHLLYVFFSLALLMYSFTKYPWLFVMRDAFSLVVEVKLKGKSDS